MITPLTQKQSGEQGVQAVHRDGRTWLRGGKLGKSAQPASLHGVFGEGPDKDAEACPGAAGRKQLGGFPLLPVRQRLRGHMPQGLLSMTAPLQGSRMQHAVLHAV